MSIELRAAARYQLIDRVVVAERAGLGWWMLHAAANAGGVQLSWAVAPDGRIYQGTVEAAQNTNPATFRPLGPLTDLTADDLVFMGDASYPEGNIDQANRRTLE
jgi:hypothetical protein